MISIISYFCLLLLFKTVHNAPTNTTTAIDCKACELNTILYTDHYEYLNCVPVMREDCPKCIKRYDCPRNYLADPNTDDTICPVANFTYKLGEQVEYRKSYCSFCSCVDEARFLAPVPIEDESDESTTAAITASTARTPALPKVIARTRCSRFSCSRVSIPDTAGKHCFKEKDDDNCCPKTTCVNEEELAKNNCEFNGRKFAFGESIPVTSCRSCICNEQFNANDTSACKIKPRCALEDLMLSTGCIPIYTEECCPSNYHCPPEDAIVKPAKREAFDANKCYFNGKTYDLGQKLDIDNNCVTCDCQIPPYFTCKVSSDCD